MNEKILAFIIYAATIFVFWFVYNLFHPEILQSAEEVYSKLFDKYRNTGRIQLKMYYFNRRFLKIVVISKDEVKKYYFLRKKTGLYQKFYTSNKKLENEVKVLQTKTGKKGN